MMDANNPSFQNRASSLALLNGDSKRAKAIMAKLDSVSRLLALLNNRAIALAKKGRFEEAIELYRSTLEALPDEWAQKSFQRSEVTSL